MNQPSEEIIKPPLPRGFSPAEQYLVVRTEVTGLAFEGLALIDSSKRHWDPELTMPADQKHCQLVRAFLHVEGLEVQELVPKSGVLPRTPTADEIRDVLEPWRPSRVR